MRQLTVEGVLESILELRYTGLDGEFNSVGRAAREPAHREPPLAPHGGLSVRPRRVLKTLNEIRMSQCQSLLPDLECALSWQLTDPQGTPVARERYWVTFQPGEVRVCTSCHGINDKD